MRTDFVDKHPEMYKLLLQQHEVPPRRTLISLKDDNDIVVIGQPTDPEKGTFVERFPFSPEGANKALGFLEERRMRAGLQFDPTQDGDKQSVTISA